MYLLEPFPQVERLFVTGSDVFYLQRPLIVLSNRFWTLFGGNLLSPDPQQSSLITSSPIFYAGGGFGFISVGGDMVVRVFSLDKIHGLF